MKLSSYFKDDEDVLLLNSQYVPPIRDESGHFTDGVLYLTYRDNLTHEKKLKTIVNPTSDTFITKPEYRSSFKTQRTNLPIDQVDRYNVKYNYLAKFVEDKIREDGKDIEYLKITKDAHKEAFKWRHSYFADYHISDYAMMSWLLQNNCKINNTDVSSAFLDIESDIYGLNSTEMEDGSAPINAVSVVIPFDESGKRFKHPKVFTFLLRNHIRYKEQEYFENHLDKFIEECHEEFDEKYDKPQFLINIFDDEIKMLRSLFAVLHKLRPDFILIWN